MNAARHIAPALWVLLLAALLPAAAQAGEARIAVAANFTTPAKDIGARFEAASGHTVLFSFGSTGQLYAQIAQAAPFDAFLAADRARPEAAIAAGLAVAGSRFTYATGKIALYSAEAGFVDGPATLSRGNFTRLALANPATAPYGAAAAEAMRALGVYDALRGKLVQGTSIAQTYQFVATGNAELGFVALSQIVNHARGSRWPVPETLHAPIAQDAVLLARGADNRAARDFLAFLRRPNARAVTEKYGYGPGE